METVIIALDLDKVCRVCLLESSTMFSIYSELLEQHSDEKMPTICEILVNISNINIRNDENLPSMICAKCIDCAHSAYKFQQQCNKSQYLLDSYLEQIKNFTPKDDNQVPNMNEVKILETFPSDNNDLLQEGDLLNDSLNFMKDDYLLDVGNDIKDDSDDLKSCIPLGEDTVDQLIQDNLKLGNLELISPKMDFSLHIKEEETNKPFKDMQNMNYYRNITKSGDLFYDCNICEQSFKLPNQLKLHLKSHNEDKPFVCTECRKGFKVYGSLMHHARNHSGEKAFQCKECGKRYRQSGTLTAHMRIHTGSKPYLCSICGRGFRQAPDLTYHMRTHTKEKPYMCNVCGKTMSMQCHLVQHMRSHTGEKPFKCFICDKAFPSSTRLKRHSIVHTNLKPFKCTICDKSFNRSSSLKVHTKIHNGVKSHSCPICQKSFLWAHSLRAHLLTHSKNSEIELEEPSGELSTINDDKTPENETFAIISNGNCDSRNESFQICALSAEDGCEHVDTFTLYASGDNRLSNLGNLSSLSM
ncbi:zinc finger protein 124-like [Diorhabda sublineata]|uniref:zinc finger protein 124-like n=1 Tax=Diorhabda sublineata TaxID=1163346 RepID=UPI0024E048B5|nr:zinc finger protein 124-like [Diorhabda sublineata]